MKKLILNIILLAYPLWAPYIVDVLLFWMIIIFNLWGLVLVPFLLVIGLLVAIYYGPLYQKKAALSIYWWLLLGGYFTGSLVVMFKLFADILIYSKYWPF